MDKVMAKNEALEALLKEREKEGFRMPDCQNCQEPDCLCCWQSSEANRGFSFRINPKKES